MENSLERKKKNAPGFAVVISVFLCIILFFLVQFMILLATLRLVMSDAGITTILECSLSEDNTKISEELVKDIIDEFRLDEDKIDDEFNKEMSEMIDRLVVGIAKYCITGEGDPIDVDYVCDFIEDNSDALGVPEGIQLDEDIVDQFKEELQEINDELKEEFEADENITLVQKVVNMIYSNKILYITAASAAVILVFIFLLFMGYWGDALVYTGITSLISGIIAGIISFFVIFTLATIEGVDLLPICFLIGKFVGIIILCLIVAGVLAIIYGDKLRKARRESESFS